MNPDDQTEHYGLDRYKGGLSGAQLRRVLEYIDECLNLDLTGSRLAGVTGLSKYHFGKALAKEFWAVWKREISIAIVCCVFGLALPASAQEFPPELLAFVYADGGGVKLGTTPTTPTSSGDWLPKSDSVVRGLYWEHRLPRSLSVEVDALYFPSLYRNAGRGGFVWQYPVLLKAGPHLGPVRPYVEGGPYLSYLSPVGNFNRGVTFGAGIEIRVRAGRITPEIRYNGVGPSINNQTVFLLGLGFGRK